MSISSEVWKKWEGRIVDGKFPLRKWLGGSDHSAVFLTERGGRSPQKAAVKLIPVETRDHEPHGREYADEDEQLSRWAEIAKLSHPHLLRTWEYGRCQIDGTRLLYVVMEYAEENLAEILPVRPLTADEARQMLQPTAEALTTLHRAGFVHGRMKPANILAVNDQLKISTDNLGKAGERNRASSLYDAPESALTGLSAAADMWSLGGTLLAVLTQVQPLETSQRGLAITDDIPQPLLGIVRDCLHLDPQRRCTADDILDRLQPKAVKPVAAVAVKAAEKPAAPTGRKWNAKATVGLVVIGIVLIIFIALLSGKFASHPPAIPAAQTQPVSAPPKVEAPAARSPAPFAEKEKTASKSSTRGSVRQQVMPGISQSALRTIHGTVKLGVRVDVDSSGNVTEARITTAGPSKYFANLALVAARQWKFDPPQVNGKAVSSEWMLHFQLRKSVVNAASEETRP